MKFCLPSDTRIAEIASTLSLIMTGALSFLFSTHYYPGPVSASEPSVYWSVITLLFGLLHGIALFSSTDVRMLRGVLSWFSGSFWTFMAFESMAAGLQSLHTVTTLTLGLACYYAFTVNTIITLRDELQ